MSIMLSWLPISAFWPNYREIVEKILITTVLSLQHGEDGNIGYVADRI